MKSLRSRLSSSGILTEGSRIVNVRGVFLVYNHVVGSPGAPPDLRHVIKGGARLYLVARRLDG